MDEAKEEILTETVSVQLNEREKAVIQQIVNELLLEDVEEFVTGSITPE
jgi:hypothetical protein